MSLDSYQAQAYLAAIIASSDDAIISKDLNGTITSWNPSAERIFGYTAEEAIGKHISIIIPAERLSEEDYIIGEIRQGRRVQHFEAIRRAKNGNFVPLSITVSPICDAGGNIIGASKVARDISERVQAAEQIKEASRKKDDFLANMSHELRTPMNAVVGISNLLALSKTLSDKDRQFVATLKTSADHLLNLINDLLDFAKIESGAITLESVEFNLAQELEKVLSVASIKAREKGLALKLHYPTNMHHYFMGDPLRLNQVLANLLSNAVKFTASGSITVDINGVSEQGRTMVTIRVTDTGIGIAQEHIDAIFEKFMQADESITRRFGGSGLGLAITRELIELMGGSVTVDSAPGMGATFTVVVPLLNTGRKAEAVHFSVDMSEATMGMGKNVLLVEDYAPNVMVAGEMLARFGYDYDVAENGVEAIRKFQNGVYDVILMDVQMHEMDGLEATRRIRKIEEERGFSRTPIIAMTAHVREQDKSMCLAAGMDDFIPKPFEPELLSQKINQYAPDRNILKFQQAGL